MKIIRTPFLIPIQHNLIFPITISYIRLNLYVIKDGNNEYEMDIQVLHYLDFLVRNKYVLHLYGSNLVQIRTYCPNEDLVMAKRSWYTRDLLMLFINNKLKPLYRYVNSFFVGGIKEEIWVSY